MGHFFFLDVKTMEQVPKVDE